MFTRSSLICTIQNTISDENARTVAIDAINRAYLDNCCYRTYNGEEDLFVIIDNYEQGHLYNPETCNEDYLTSEIYTYL